MSKEKHTYNLIVSEEMYAFNKHSFRMLFDMTLNRLRSEGWYVYEIEEDHTCVMDLGLRKFLFHCQRVKSPRLNLGWCKVRLIE